MEETKASISIIENSEIFKALMEVKEDGQKLSYYLKQEPPKEWVLEGISEVTKEKYKYLPIHVLEFLLEEIFGGFNDEIISQNIFSNSDNSITVTTSVIIQFANTDGRFVYRKSGTASITVKNNFYYKEGVIKFTSDSKKMIWAQDFLKTATPLSFTEAKKNAIKNFCNLFGRNLNREILEFNQQDSSENGKIDADLVIKKKYENAISKKDFTTAQEIENNYNLH